MDYKEKYEMALEGIQEILGSGEDSIKMSRLQLRLQGIFPELKESEGKDIKQFLIDFIKVCGWTEKKDQGWPSKEKCIAWLEKQGNIDSHVKLPTFTFDDILALQCCMKTATANEYKELYVQLKSLHDRVFDAYLLEKQGGQKPIVPKFKVGDWVIDKQGIVHQIANVIKNVTNNTYGYDIVGGGYFNDNTEGVRLWTIQDAKDGDVLVLNDEMFIYAHRKQLYSIAVAHCFVDSDGCFHFDGEFGHTEKGNSIYPATKEQRDTLMKAMADDGYTFDFEKKELKKIEQKPAEWSEEDERDFGIIYGIIYNSCNAEDASRLIAWLKALKDRVQPQPSQEWSEEDMKMIRLLVAIFEVNYPNGFYKVNPIDTPNMQGIHSSEIINWLKSLRPQKQWKPSDEQLDSLYDVLNPCDGLNRDVLESLYNDLKKLRED